MAESNLFIENPIYISSEIAMDYLKSLLLADRTRAHQIVMDALQNGLSIKELYLNVFQQSQREVGRLWLLNKVSIAEEHFCTAATQSIMSELYPQIISTPRIGRTMVGACVGSELHEIGMRMVADFFEMGGWDTYYLGAAISSEQMLVAIEKYKPQLVAISATMTYHVSKVKEMISFIKIRSQNFMPLIMVGGIPFNISPELWRTTGADMYASDADQAIKVADQMLENR